MSSRWKGSTQPTLFKFFPSFKQLSTNDVPSPIQSWQIGQRDHAWAWKPLSPNLWKQLPRDCFRRRRPPHYNTGLTRFGISFSHEHTHFAFKWDGEGEAVYGIGTKLERKPVGRSWTSDSKITWMATSVTTEDVSAKAAGATLRDEETTIFIAPY